MGGTVIRGHIPYSARDVRREAEEFTRQVEERFGFAPAPVLEERQRRRYLRRFLGTAVVHTVWRGTVDGDDGWRP